MQLFSLKMMRISIFDYTIQFVFHTTNILIEFLASAWSKSIKKIGN